MSMFEPGLLEDIRARFHHVDRCPYQDQGARVFFENAGGSLTLKSVVEVTARLAAIPDNQGRDNPASAEMMRLIAAGKDDMMTFLGADSGMVFAGETGTECLFRVIRTAIMNASAGSGGGQVIGATLEHPATSSAAQLWSARAGLQYTAAAHDAQTCALTADDYARCVTARTQVATIIHTSPVSGTSVDISAVAAAIRAASPDCFIIVDGIQHAPHGGISVADYGIDAYAVSGYKVFSRHNYGFAWVSGRLSAVAHDHLIGAAADVWELGTRDASVYATFSEVAAYLDWLGARFTASTGRRARINAAAAAIAAHEHGLVEAMLNGVDQQKGLAQMPSVFIIGGAGNPRREGLVSLAVRGVPSADVVRALAAAGIRVHLRRDDHYSKGVLEPLGMKECVRVSLAHYNSIEEVAHFLRAMEAITAEAGAG